MGETAEMMLDGTLCVGCGVVFDDMVPSEAEFAAAKRERRMPVSNAEPPGHPRKCEDCQADDPDWTND